MLACGARASAQALPPTEPATTAQAEKTLPAPEVVDKKTATERRLAAEAACAARDPACDWVSTFSSLERSSIRRTLQAHGYEVEPAPWGKVIGKIHVHNEDVFAERNWLQFFNLFHVTTRSPSIRNELTINEGELWDDERIGESSRRLKDPVFTTVVAIVPVKSADDGKVDVLVVTRDVWSLRLNTQYTIQETSLTNFIMSLSENNFLGRRKTVALGLTMDQGSIAVGPLYIDKNFLGQHLDFRFRLDKIFVRKSLDVITANALNPMAAPIPTGDPGGIQDDGVLRSEGSAATVTLSKTLWSLASKWGAGASFGYRNAVSRSFLRTGLRPYDDPDTPERDNVPREYRLKTWSTSANVTRQWGGAYKQQLEIGHTVSSTTPSLLGTFALDPMLEAHFIRDVFPRTELVSAPYISWSLFRAKYATIRNVDTFELAEDIRFGPDASVTLSQGLEALGSDRNFTRPSITAGWTLPWCRDGFVRLSAGGSIRIQGGETIDNTATAQIRAASPTYRYLRVLTQVHMETRWNDTQNAFYTLGSDSGLRGYGIAQFDGNRRIVGQVEARSVPFPFWVLRVGGVAFYDGGGVASSFGQMQLYHDVGFGMRMLIPQSSRQLFRFDLAFPLVDAPGITAGVPRFSAGFDSYF